MRSLVSVIIPVYNMEGSIEKATDSILAQDYENIEVILVDDGSNDNTLDALNRIAAKDGRVAVLHTENRGAGPARNTGIEASSGKYLYFPDADDYLEPNAISSLVKAMEEEEECDLVVFGYRVSTHEGITISTKVYEAFSNSGEHIRMAYSDYFGMDRRFSIQGAPWNKFFNGDAIRENAIRYPALRRHQDEAFISRYMSHCKRVRFIPDVLYTYFANTVTLEWKKYPVDYADAVAGLNQVWQETICSWNKNDSATRLLVENCIFGLWIKALVLSYSPKMGFNYFQRLKWIKKICVDNAMNKYPMSIAKNVYPKCVLFAIKCRLYCLVMFLLYILNIKRQVSQNK